MALMIGGPRPAPPVEEEMVEEVPVEEMAEEMPMDEPELPMEEEMPMEESAGIVPPDTAGYLGPEHGPFRCGSCSYYAGEGQCLIVAGPIEEDGCCNLFAKAEAEDPMDEEMPMDEEVPAEDYDSDLMAEY